MRKQLLLTCAGALALSGCAIGPNFHRPDMLKNAAFQSNALPATIHARKAVVLPVRPRP
ncbi:hypothetical protein [Asaia platycodi]|uniref:hypothetical protein n=1 Tax=Asaia platycodi TaxID=610243 RepID=UPI000A9DE3D9|nr:hypothetical protein [Asaia platycodi]